MPRIQTTEDRRLEEHAPARNIGSAGGPIFPTAVGNGSGGLQSRRHCLGIFPARPRAFARVSLGRGRPRRDQRPPPTVTEEETETG